MIIALYAIAAILMAVGSLYFAWQNRDFRKFLAGAFFVSSGILFYLYLADVSVPLLGTNFVFWTEIAPSPELTNDILLISYAGIAGDAGAKLEPGPAFRMAKRFPCCSASPCSFKGRLPVSWRSRT